VKLVVGDFETRFGTGYSLRDKGMTHQKYIMDERFKAHGCGLKIGDAPARWIPGKHLPAVFAKIDWSDACFIGHNLGFDASILAWRYGITPKMYVDTLALARAQIGANAIKHGLDALGELLLGSGKPEGLSATYNLIDLPPEIEAQLGKYCEDDCEKTYQLFKLLMKGMTKTELLAADWCTRVYLTPKFMLDQEVLAQYLEELAVKKAEALASVGMTDRAVLNSAEMFAEALRSFGVDPPTKMGKPSKKTGESKIGYAFAKTDQALKDLLDHPRPEVQALVAARLEIKSTNEENKAGAYYESAQLGGAWPVSIKYAGAMNTQRFSGDKHGGGNCLLPSCEVLTPTGWKRFDQLTQGESIATWDSELGGIGWEMADIVKRYYVGDLVHVETKTGTHNCHYTLDHRVPTQTYDTSGAWRDSLAGELKQSSQTKIALAGTWLGGTSPITPWLARYLAAAQADGHYEKGGCRFQFHKQRKQDRLEMLLRMVGFTYGTGVGSNGSLPRHRVLAENGNWSKYKKLGPWLLDLSADALEAFVDETQYWDSHKRGGSWQYFTADKSNAEWIQTAAHLTGRSANVQMKANHEDKQGNGLTLYTVNVKPRDFAVLEPKRPWLSHTPYAGDVYCLRTGRGGFPIRSNGSVAVTFNCQNMGRGSRVRDAICAPEGYKIMASDLSQIEARISLQLGAYHYLWNRGISDPERCPEMDALDKLRNNEDIYCWFGTMVYGRTITKADVMERRLSKTAVLGLCFGMGYKRFFETCREQGLTITMEFAKMIVRLYRKTFPNIVKAWKSSLQQLSYLMQGLKIPAFRFRVDPNGPANDANAFNILTPENDPIFGQPALRMPNGQYLKYPMLTCETKGTKTEWSYWNKGNKTYMHAPKSFENAVQALAGQLCREMLVELQAIFRAEDPGMGIELQVHDELVALIIDDPAWLEWARGEFNRVMQTSPTWMPELPVACETKEGYTYGECK